MSVILAGDFGATHLRLALIDEHGATLAAQSLPAPREQGAGGRAEIDPDLWWDAFGRMAEALAKIPQFRDVAAVAICGMTSTQVLIGRDGRPLGPAITWNDTRASGEESLSPFHPAARLAWLEREEPARFGRIAAVLDPKDYLHLRLTGRAATDTVSSARLAASPYASLLPPRLSPTDKVGTIASGLPGALGSLAGRAVVCLANDTWAAVVGLGALRHGFAYNISGTTEVFGVVSEKPASAPGLLTVDWSSGLHQLGGPGQNGAECLRWLSELTRTTELEALLAAPRHQPPALFMPYLQGERVPHWNEGLRGAFIGLDRGHRAGDLAWAVLEGIACLNRLVLERAEAALGFAVAEIRFGGGAAASPTWCQVKADLCERTVAIGATPEPGLLGAAIAAWTAVGRFASLAAAQDAIARVARRFEPDPSRANRARKLYGAYLAADRVLPDLSRALSEL